LELLLARHLWGIPETWEEAFPRIRAAGYKAIETPLPEPGDRERFRDLLDEYGFEYIAMVLTNGNTVADYVNSFREQVEISQSLQAIMINSHSGRDSWTESQSRDYFGQALAIETSLNTPVAHETHRGRILFNPWVTQRFLQEFDQLHLCCDLSHWVCVCERLLDDEMDGLQLCAERCVHLHTRVGYEQGPQVPDPRDPHYLPHLEAHERWWQMIWDAQAAQGRRISTMTPEFGPPGYLHTLPFTGVPVSNLWDVCNWMAERQSNSFRGRYNGIN